MISCIDMTCAGTWFGAVSSFILVLLAITGYKKFFWRKSYKAVYIARCHIGNYSNVGKKE